MSGGSWDYLYSKVEDAADRLEESRELHRQAFGKHLRLCAEALHDIEWHDSGDSGPEHEIKSIEAVLAHTLPESSVEHSMAQLRGIRDQINQVLKEVEK